MGKGRALTTPGTVGEVLDAISRRSLKSREATTEQDPRRVNCPTGSFGRIGGAQEYQTTDPITIFRSRSSAQG